MSELRLSNGVIEAGIALDFGPRVMHYGFVGEAGVFAVSGVTRETPHGLWRAYGGHRLWAAPERFPETYALDAAPPQVEQHGRTHAVVRGRASADGIVPSIALTLAPASSVVLVEHVLTNTAQQPRTMAPWGITVVRANGVAVVPNPHYLPQPDALLPVRTLALWRYSDLSDGRFATGPSFLRLRCDPRIGAPIKIGVACERGWCAYVSDGVAFVVQAAHDGRATYPDLGSSFEFYSEGAFFEVETLGALTTLAPGESARASERWSLVRVDGDDDATLARVLGEHTGT